MRVTVFGSGYVGLVTGACMAETGNDVVCVDIDKDKVEALEQGRIPIYEPGLEALIHRNQDAGRIRFTTDVAAAVKHGEFQFIAVGTPPDEDGSADLQYVLAVAQSIAEHMDDRKIIVDKSTVPVGTADRVAARVGSVLAQRECSLEFHVVSNPEFLKEGAAIEDFMKPDRIILGTSSDEATAAMRALYKPFNRNHDRVIVMGVRSAELTKYAANAMLATKISFMNEIANIAERVDADVEQVRRGIGADPRIGYHFIYPGVGYGGSCFPKDVSALTNSARQAGYDAELLHAVEAVNARQKSRLAGKIIAHFGGDVQGRKFALWGLAFKPGTDDMREAPSVVLVHELVAAGARVVAYDPEAMHEAKRIFGPTDGFSCSDNAMAALTDADALAIATEWQEFRSPDFDAMAKRLQEKLIFDGRNLYDPQTLKHKGFTYYSIGRQPSIH